MVTTQTRRGNGVQTARPQNVKTAHRDGSVKQGKRPLPKLERTTFRTSRVMDFFNAKELTTQTGHGQHEWAMVIVKEGVDNALDACEESDIQPIVEVTIDSTGITIRDNGPGLPESTLHGALDFTVRASNREAYVSPCRGAQGNALKTLLPMPHILDADHGRFIVEAHGKRHVLRCGADPISQHAVVHDDVQEMETSGTSIRVEWGAAQVWPFHQDGKGYGFDRAFRDFVAAYALVNPHLTLTLDFYGARTTWEATDPEWGKWKPHQPTSSHWYEQRHLERLIGAYITHDAEQGRDRLVSDFVKEFDGLSGSQRRSKVLADAGLHRAKLSEFVVNGRFDSPRIAALLAAMQHHSRPVKSKRLGVIGEEHLTTRLLELGARPDSITYKRRVAKDGLPWVLESAFGHKADDNARRSIVSGANWSAAIANPFRSFGDTGEGLETVLSNMRATADEPIIFVLHLAHPRVEYTDRGKSALVIGGAE